MYRGLQRPSSVFCCCRFRTYLRVNGSRTCTISVFRYQRKTKGKSYAPSFWVMWPTLSELISAVRHPIESRFFLNERYAHVVSWKKYGAFVVPPETHEIRYSPNALRIFPGTCIHLPEDREMEVYFFVIIFLEKRVRTYMRARCQGIQSKAFLCLGL